VHLQPSGIARRALCWILLVDLAGPSLAGAAFHCRTSGSVLAAPCVRAERADPAKDGGCCPGTPEHRRGDRPIGCCESTPSEPALAAVPLGASGPSAAPGTPGVVGAGTLATGPRPAVRVSPRPPGDPPLFLLHGRLLC
jgi:hypothetical protein